MALIDILLIQFKENATATFIIVVILLSLVQVSKIEINPWDSIFGWFGMKINGELLRKIGTLEYKLEDVRKESEERAVTDMRWHILNFAYTCRINEEHTKEQWNHVLDQAKKYETYIKKHKLDNGVIEEDTKYIRELYSRLSREGRIK